MPTETAYSLDTDCPTHTGINPTYVASRRLCSPCQQEGSTETFTTADPTSVMERINTCCRAKRGYMPPSAPLAEIIYRLLLAQNNAPTTPGDIVSHIRRLRSQRNIRNVSPSTVVALLDGDYYYGFTKVQE